VQIGVAAAAPSMKSPKKLDVPVREAVDVELGRALFLEAQDAMFVADLDGRCLDVNTSACVLTGYPRAELIGLPLTELLVTDTTAHVPPAGGLPEPAARKTWAIRRRDGTMLSVQVALRPLTHGRRLQIVRHVPRHKAAERLETFWALAVESSISGFAFADLDARITYANPAFVRMWGYDHESDIIGRDIMSLGSSDEHTHQVLTEILEKGGWVGEAVAKRKDGQPFAVSMTSSIVRDAEGRPIGMLGSFIDVTERKRAEQALHETAEKYRTLVESAHDIIFTCDASGRYLYVNSAAATTLGLTPDQVIGRTVDELFQPDVAATYREGVRRVIETGENLISEQPSDIAGQRHWFSNILQPIRDHLGQVTAVQAVVRDITSFKLAEEALRESEERLRQAVRVSHIGIFDHDHLRNTIYWSAQQRAIYGWGPDEEISPIVFDAVGGGQPAYLDLVHPEDRARVAAGVTYAHDPAGDGLFDIEHRLIRRDGTVRWLTTRSQTFFEGGPGDRRPVRTVGAVRDITEQKLAEEERAKLQTQLVQAQKMESVGRLAGGVAHDFNNMLSVISGHVELSLERLDAAHPVHANLLEIQNAARRSADLIRQLLAFARRQAVVPRVLALNDVVEGSLSMLRRLIGESVELAWMPGGSLWPVQIDPSQVDQVLANLSTNARDAIHGVGRIEIRTANVVLDRASCARHEGSVPGDHVMLHVSDNGGGMDQETLAHVFEPFYTTKTGPHGTGLGLATVYGIVKQNRGFIEVESHAGRGTTVSILLPRAHGRVPDAWQGATPASGPKTGNETVLLVEDEPLVLGLTNTMLSRLGYTVLAAATPAEAVHVAGERRQRIDLLVTDVVMPEMNGRELADRLRSLNPGLRCLFLSGYFASAVSSGGVLEPGVHFLQKPFSMNDLATKLREVLES
jgi:PAS domain S-box-containing protein